MQRSAFKAVVSSLLALVLSSCGGEDAGGPDLVPPDATPLDPCVADAGYELQPIVNFEPFAMGTGINRNAACNQGVSCAFYFNGDRANSPPDGCNPELNVESTPPLASSALRGRDIPGGRCETSTSALNIMARNLAVCIDPRTGRKGWGAGMDVTFSSPFDATEWEGFSFWVKRGSPPVPGDNRTDNKSIIALAVDQYSSGEPACDATDPALATVQVPDTAKCDPFGASVTLTDEWSFVPVRFSAMRQKGFGVASPIGGLDTSGIIRLQFLLTAGEWDFWIDDISFFRAPSE
jgi:hypothetical protein